MRNFMLMPKLEKIEDGKGGGGAPEPKAPPAEKPAEGDPAAQGEGDKFDELGYEKVAPEEGNKEPEKVEPKAEPQKVETPATGYGEEPPKVEEPPAPAPAAKEEVKLDYEVKTEGLSEDQVAKLKTYAKKHGLSKEAAQDLIDDRRAEVKTNAEAMVVAEKEYKAEVARKRAEWYNELKVDPNFGGEKFGHNVLQVEKVVQEFMPNTKKILTERKTMLPPYVMRDLVGLANRLYSTEKLVQGEAVIPNKEGDKEVDDSLAFYT